MDICRPDCGWFPDLRKKFKEVEAKDLKDAEAFDLTGITNMHVDLSAEDANVQIQDFANMINGKVYTLTVSNGASKQLEVLLPDGSTLYNGTITKANGMTLAYRFWTDGESIFCDRAVYS